MIAHSGLRRKRENISSAKVMNRSRSGVPPLGMGELDDDAGEGTVLEDVIVEQGHGMINSKTG